MLFARSYFSLKSHLQVQLQLGLRIMEISVARRVKNFRMVPLYIIPWKLLGSTPVKFEFMYHIRVSCEYQPLQITKGYPEEWPGEVWRITNSSIPVIKKRWKYKIDIFAVDQRRSSRIMYGIDLDSISGIGGPDTREYHKWLNGSPITLIIAHCARQRKYCIVMYRDGTTLVWLNNRKTPLLGFIRYWYYIN